MMLFNNYHTAEKPLVIGLDFGTAEESAPQFARSGKFETIWIDHHPMPDALKPPSNYINPMEYKGNSSISTGFVSSLVASASGVQSSDLAEASLISDMSMYANHSDLRAFKIAEVLDYLTVRGSDHLRRPKGMESVIADQDALDSMYAEVHLMVENALSAGQKIAAKYKCKNDIIAVVVDFAKIKRMGMDYPLPGRYASRLQYLLEQSNPRTVTIVHYRSFISVRAGREISHKLKIPELILAMGSDTNGAIKGGGHMEASSIDVGDYGMENTLSLFLHLIGAENPK
jgi:RecJ-like exonuclease